MRSVRLNLWILAPEMGISNIAVSCSTVGSRATSTKLGGNGSSGATGGSVSGPTSINGRSWIRTSRWNRWAGRRSRYVNQGDSIWSLIANWLEVGIVIQKVVELGKFSAPATAGP